MTEMYQIVTGESIDKMMQSFVDEEEVEQFECQLISTCQEIGRAYMMVQGIDPSNKEMLKYMQKKMMGAFALFCRLNIETIHAFVRLIEFKELTQEEFKKMVEEIDKK